MKCYTTEELKELLDEAFVLGWQMSGEGWNHEHPGDAHTETIWQETRDELIAELLHRDTGGYDGKGNKA